MSLLITVTFGCLVFGLFKPAAFTRLFKEKTRRGRIAMTFGGALMFIGKLVAPSTPSIVATAPNALATPSANKAADERMRLADERAKAAEARAAKVENVAKVKDTKPLPPMRSRAIVSVQTIEGLGKREAGIVDDVHYIISEIETASSIGNDFSSNPADGLLYVVRIAAYNNDKETHNINTSLIKLLDDQDREFDTSKGSTALVMSGDKTAELFSAQIQRGTRKQFSLVYDAPADASGLKLKIPGGFLSRAGAAIIKAPK